jgi:hypothetical protein
MADGGVEESQAIRFDFLSEILQFLTFSIILRYFLYSNEYEMFWGEKCLPKLPYLLAWNVLFTYL